MNRSSMPKQVMAFSNGGLASFIPRQTQIAGQPHMLAYINPQEEALLRDFGGSGIAGPGGIPSYPPESAINADYNAISGSDKYNAVDDDSGGQSATGGSFNQAIDDKANNEAIRGSDPAVTGGFSGSVSGGSILSGLKSGLQNFAQDVKMGLSTFGMNPEKQAEALAKAGYTQAQINSYQSRTAQSMKEAAEAGKDYGGDEAGLLLADVVKRDEEKEDGPPTSTDFRFYGGYQPRTRDDVLVASPGAGEDFVAPADPRIAPIFGSNASLDSQLGIVPTPTLEQGSAPIVVTDASGKPIPGQFNTMQELMEYQKQNPGLNLMGEYQRLQALQGGVAQPFTLPHRGIASLMGGQPATEAMYQGIMS